MVFSKKIEEQSSEEKLKYFNSLPYSIILKKRDQKYSLTIPEISLIAVNNNLQDAYKDLSNKKEKFFKDMIASHCEDDIALPRNLSKKNELLWQLKIFVCKLLIVSVIFIVSCAFGGRMIMNKVVSISGMDMARTVVKNVAFQIERVLDAPEEKQEERIKKIRDLLNKLKPIINEIKKEPSVEDLKDFGQ